MSSNIKDLDTLIRERARNELEQRLEQAFRNLRSVAGPIPYNATLEISAAFSWVHVKMDEHGRPISVKLELCELLKKLEPAVVGACAPQHEQAAVRNFLERAEALSREIDELREAQS